MARKLYLTYTRELTPHAIKVCEVARHIGWKVTDGPAEFPFSLDKQLEVVFASDALMVLSAYAYGAELGNSEQEILWNFALSKGKRTCALLGKSDFPVSLVEGLDKPERFIALTSFQDKLKRAPFVASFGYQPDSVAAPASEQLQKLDSEISIASQIRVFVVWDFSVAGLPMVLETLRRRPPGGYVIAVPGVGAAAGEIFRDVVLPEIKKANRVLVVTDKPNANVAFEAGLALGFGKPISLIHFGSAIPAWLNYSLFKGFIVNAVRTLEDLRLRIVDEQCWFTPPDPAPVPDHGSTLFLAPTAFVGAALHELRMQQNPHWRTASESTNFKDISQELGRIAQVVWAISAYSEGADVRDGAENSANAVIAGWFYARAHTSSLKGCVSFLRQNEARVVSDVQVDEVAFHDIDSFASLLRNVPDRRLPPVEALEEKVFEHGELRYRMIRVPSTGDRNLWVGAHPVTNAQYRAFWAAKSSQPVSDRTNSSEDTSRPPQDLENEMISNLPVVGVSLQDAEEFCRWAGLDLPGPGLWPQFARAGCGDRDKYWWGDDESALVLAAWFAANSENKLHDVCTLRANQWGFFDVLGNVWELTRYEETIRNQYGEFVPVKSAQGMGGAFNTPSTGLLIPRKLSAVDKDSNTGFRCICYDL
jgi:hypothetical protein